MIKSDAGARYRKILVEQSLIQRQVPGMRCRQSGLKLICRGSIKPCVESGDYRIEIVYMPWLSPKVRILEPRIETNGDIHMYTDGTLCLFDWREQAWDNKWHLHEIIVPWTAEWL